MRMSHEFSKTVVLTAPHDGHDDNSSSDSRKFFKRKSSLKSLDNSSGSTDKAVTFSKVAIRDYSICPGDNPSVSRGVPLSLDWGYDQAKSHDINDFEEDREGCRRTSDDLKLPSLQRVHILKDNGYSRGDINERVKEVEQAREKRIETRRKLERDDRRKKLRKKIVKAFTISLSKPKTSPESKSSPGSKARDSLVSKKNVLDVQKTIQYEKSILDQLEDETITSSISSKKSDASDPDCNMGPVSEGIIIHESEN